MSLPHFPDFLSLVFVFFLLLPYLSLTLCDSLCPQLCISGPLLLCPVSWLAVRCQPLEAISSPREKKFLVLNGPGETSAHRKWEFHVQRSCFLLVSKARQTRTAIYVWKDRGTQAHPLIQLSGPTSAGVMCWDISSSDVTIQSQDPVRCGSRESGRWLLRPNGVITAN